ncbi:MAG: hypothetical protein D6801_03115 [Alphaproteobacteria bacterium]|nr:MAG: hypothetical protein D6801_03115 [Alphaproteobacteria bacterium]
METMKRIFLAAGLSSALLAAAPASAQSFQDVLIAELASQGFTHIQVSRTFLGRVRIVATSPNGTREIIFNPRTSEILRDYLNAAPGSVNILPVPLAGGDSSGPVASGPTSPRSDDGRDDRGGNSGPGGGGGDHGGNGGHDDNSGHGGNDDRGGNDSHGGNDDRGGNDSHGGNGGHGGNDDHGDDGRDDDKNDDKNDD